MGKILGRKNLMQTEDPAQDEGRVSCAACVGMIQQHTTMLPEALIAHHIVAHAEFSRYYVSPENICKDLLVSDKTEEFNATRNSCQLMKKDDIHTKYPWVAWIKKLANTFLKWRMLCSMEWI